VAEVVVVVGRLVVVPAEVGSGGVVVVRGTEVVVVEAVVVGPMVVLVGGTEVVVVVRETEWRECAAWPDAVVVTVELVVLGGVVELVVVVPVELVVLGVVELVVVAPVVVVTASVVVVVDATTEPETVIGAEAPDAPEELSVTSSAIVSGSTRVTLTVATPPVKVTLLPAAQAPSGG
jgi:hypothetical protein